MPKTLRANESSHAPNHLNIRVAGENLKVEESIEKKTQEIKRAMSALGRKLEAGDNSQLLHWVIPRSLACAHRPLRHHPVYGGSGNNLGPAAAILVHQWAKDIRESGIKSVIPLMHDRDLRCYASLDLGATNLLEFYKEQGFDVFHVPWEDPHHKKSTPSEKRITLLRVRQEALAAYEKLAKPVVVQCSAGIDRSSPVAAFIYVMEQGKNGRT
jgi:signal transduction histidine kinase